MRWSDAGVHSVSINLELYDSGLSRRLMGAKHRFARPHFEETVTQAVELLRRTGRVRSLVIPGLSQRTTRLPPSSTSRRLA